jgi:predicted RecA/RadA family phage recombinase
MAKNQRYTNALHISVPVPAGTKSGDPVKVGQICGVAVIDREADGTATVWLDGSYTLDVAGAVGSFGAPIYIKGDNTLTATASGNFLFGTALGTKGTGTGPLEVAPIGYTTQTAAGA